MSVPLVYKFYKAQVTGSGYLPEGNCLATLTLDDNRQPTWSDLNEEFERLGVPCFENSVRLGVLDNLPPLKPYSDEAIQHLTKHQLPSLGYVMVKISGPPTPKPGVAQAKGDAAKAKPAFGYNHPMFNPPPRLIRPQAPPKSEDSE